VNRVIIRAGVFFFWFINLTLRVRISARARGLMALQSPTSSLFLVWHNRTLLAFSGFCRFGNNIPLTVLVSASGDGAFVAEVIHAFGLQSARGSSSRRAFEATRELISALEAGRNILITPDGPRGPIYTVKPGAADVGRGYARAIYLLGFNCSSAWHLKSWDKFIIPKPFARLELDVEKIDIAENISPAMLQEKLTALNK
jgi:lysophospholipid acyltransferase (LPLAT)-like uncharacterized protein